MSRLYTMYTSTIMICMHGTSIYRKLVPCMHGTSIVYWVCMVLVMIHRKLEYGFQMCQPYTILNIYGFVQYLSRYWIAWEAETWPCHGHCTGISGMCHEWTKPILNRGIRNLKSTWIGVSHGCPQASWADPPRVAGNHDDNRDLQTCPTACRPSKSVHNVVKV